MHPLIFKIMTKKIYKWIKEKLFFIFIGGVVLASGIQAISEEPIIVGSPEVITDISFTDEEIVEAKKDLILNENQVIILEKSLKKENIFLKDLKEKTKREMINNTLGILIKLGDISLESDLQSALQNETKIDLSKRIREYSKIKIDKLVK